jgi:hypothetical protein
MEARCCALRAQTDGDQLLRDATFESLARYIKQFKEEIALYEIRRKQGDAPIPPDDNAVRRAQSRTLRSDREVENTRAKLAQLEAMYQNVLKESRPGRARPQGRKTLLDEHDQSDERRNRPPRGASAGATTIGVTFQ